MTPDRWVVVTITREDDSTIDKVLAGFYGGYLYGDAWRINSGIERVDTFDDRYEFHGYSGSVYVCYKNRYGMTMLTQSIFEQMCNLFPTEINDVYKDQAV
jgi:hypothetical protein